MSPRRTRRAGLLADVSAVAAVEFGLIAPLLALFLAAIFDLGIAVYQRSVVVAAVAAGGEFALLAEQNSVAAASIVTQTSTVVQANSNGLLTAGNVTVTINNGTAATNSCCLISTSPGVKTFTCAATAPTCSDGSNPGMYIEIVGTHALTPILNTSSLVGASVSSDLVERLK
jgi:Flp pilus assembly protein TadG